MLFRFVSLIACLLVLSSVKAQDTTQYNLKLNISGRRIRGTFNQNVLATKLDFRLENKRWSLYNSTSYRYNETNGTTIEDNWYHLTSASYHVKGLILFPTAFYHYDNNLMFRLNSRQLFGGALSIKKRWKGQYLRLDAGAGYDITNYNGAQFENTQWVGSERKRRVMIVHFVHEHKFFKGKLTFFNDFFYRHSLEEQTDYFYWIAPRLSVRVFKGLSASISYEYRLENVHLINLSSDNTTLLYGLTFYIGNY
ncbi:hypothetical protein BKI52_21980 [marine bacterium AO1-C]|nr:hypothetical protein BKI52_21980 [marine bacterium AO1-C]